MHPYIVFFIFTFCNFDEIYLYNINDKDCHDNIMKNSLETLKTKYVYKRNNNISNETNDKSYSYHNTSLFIVMIVIGFFVFFIQMYLTFGFELLIIIMLIIFGKLTDFIRTNIIKKSFSAPSV